MQRLFSYATGLLALLLVAASTISALTYATLHHSETLSNLGTSTLSGVGMAVGGCLGSALILRFKAARRFVKNLVHEINSKYEPSAAKTNDPIPLPGTFVTPNPGSGIYD
jgi:hypothetical protein